MSDLDQSTLQGIELELENSIPRQVITTPGMITSSERSLLFSLTRNYYSGMGKIVDVGAFLGASTVSLASGFVHSCVDTNSTLTARPIEVFELGLLNGGTSNYLRNNEISDYHNEGDCYLDLLRNNLISVASFVNLNAGDVCDYTWNKNLPIELLFFDAMHSKKVIKHLYQAFVRHILPGNGILIIRNYFVEYSSCFRVIQEYLMESFEFLGLVSSSAIFRLRKSIDASRLLQSIEFDFTASEQVELLSKSEIRAKRVEDKFLTSFLKIEVLATHDMVKARADYRSLIENYREYKFSGPARRRIDAAKASIEHALGLPNPREFQQETASV